MDPQVWHKIAAISGNLFFRFTKILLSCSLHPFLIASVVLICKFSERKRGVPYLTRFVNETGVAALGLGTYGAHVFKPQDPTYKEVSPHFLIPMSYPSSVLS